MRFLLFIIVASCALAVCGCATQPDADAADAAAAKPRVVVSSQNPWSHLNLHNDPDDFQFAIVTDRTGGHRPGVFMDAVNKLNLLQPEFVMSVGDLIEGYTEDQAQIDSEWDEFNGFIDQLEMPFFYLPGNHDISNQVMADDWSRRFGAAYYHFVYRDVLFLCLNSQGPPSSQIDAAQIEYVANTLAANPQVRWTLVFLHEPLWNYSADTRWDQIEALLAGRPHSVFAGHFHTYTKHVRQGQNYIVLATTGGASALRGPLFGQFDHFVWVTMTDKGPRLANLMLDGIWDENVRTEATAQLLAPLLTRPLGYLPASKEHPESSAWGGFGYGGPLATAGGVVFVASRFDAHLRAFDMTDGTELWSDALPAEPQATPMSYERGAEQYVVIAAGGARTDGKGQGDYLIAYKVKKQDQVGSGHLP